MSLNILCNSVIYIKIKLIKEMLEVRLRLIMVLLEVLLGILEF